MDALIPGISTGELTQLVVIAIALVVILIIARLAFRLTAALFRIGCAAVLVIAGAFALIYYLN